MSQEHTSVCSKQLVREASLYTCFPADFLRCNQTSDLSKVTQQVIGQAKTERSWDASLSQAFLSFTSATRLHSCAEMPVQRSGKLNIVNISIININHAFSAQHLHGCFFVGLFGCSFNTSCLPRYAFSMILDWKKNQFLQFNLVNTQCGRDFLINFIINPVNNTSAGCYACNKKPKPLRSNSHQEITLISTSFIWNQFQIAFPIEWSKSINLSQLSGKESHSQTISTFR